MLAHGRKTYFVALMTVAVGVLIEVDWVVFWDNPRAGLSLIGSGILFGLMRWITQQTTVKAAEQAPAPTEPSA